MSPSQQVSRCVKGLKYSTAVSLQTLPRVSCRIPAAGHIHCATCNHKKTRKGAVWQAAFDGDAAALEAALAAGASTEESDEEVRSRRKASPTTHWFNCVGCLSQGNTALIRASPEGHVEVVRTLLAAGADVNAKGKVRVRPTASNALAQSCVAPYPPPCHPSPRTHLRPAPPPLAGWLHSSELGGFLWARPCRGRPPRRPARGGQREGRAWEWGRIGGIGGPKG